MDALVRPFSTRKHSDEGVQATFFNRQLARLLPPLAKVEVSSVSRTSLLKVAGFKKWRPTQPTSPRFLPVATVNVQLSPRFKSFGRDGGNAHPDRLVVVVTFDREVCPEFVFVTQFL